MLSLFENNNNNKRKILAKLCHISVGKELSMQAGGALLIPYTYIKVQGKWHPNVGEIETEENMGFSGQPSWSVSKLHVL